jgi:hypothetical protein
MDLSDGPNEKIQAVIEAGVCRNATSGGTAHQIKFMVQQGCIRPLCDFLTVADTKIVTIDIYC